jgi:hypothetical protein
LNEGVNKIRNQAPQNQISQSTYLHIRKQTWRPITHKSKRVNHKPYIINQKWRSTTQTSQTIYQKSKPTNWKPKTKNHKLQPQPQPQPQAEPQLTSQKSDIRQQRWDIATHNSQPTSEIRNQKSKMTNHNTTLTYKSEVTNWQTNEVEKKP